MLLAQRNDFLTNFSPAVATATTAAQSCRLEIPQDFAIAGLRVVVPVTVASGSSPVLNSGKDLFDLVDKITLSVNDGAENRTVFDLSGQRAKQFAQAMLGKAPASNVSATGTVADGSYTLVYDLPCADFRLPEPMCYATLLPAPRYSAKPVLTISFATGASLLASGSATITLGTVVVQVNRVAIPASIASSVKVFNFDCVEVAPTIPGTGANDVDIPAPGLYTDLLMCHFNASSVPAAISTGYTIKLQRLGVDLLTTNETLLTAATSERALNYTSPTGVYYLPFVGRASNELGLDSGLDANVGTQAGVRIQLKTGFAIAGSRKYVYRRILGNVSGLLAVR